jgi:hypothetical protein
MPTATTRPRSSGWRREMGMEKILDSRVEREIRIPGGCGKGSGMKRTAGKMRRMLMPQDWW